VMMHAINDVFTLGTYDSYYQPGSRNVANLIELPKIPSGAKSVAKGFRDMLFPNLYGAVQKAFSKAGQAGGAASLIEEKNLGGNFKGEEFYVEKFEQNLRIFISVCRDAGIEPVLMTQANRMTENPAPAVKNYIGYLQGLGQKARPADMGHYLPLNYAQVAGLEHAFNEAMRRVGAERNVLVIDLEKEVPPTKEFMYDAVHLTGAGSRKTAEIIADRLTSHLAAVPVSLVKH
jgi:lysophospholipase L1-like esterase